jgi:hypothetical protein
VTQWTRALLRRSVRPQRFHSFEQLYFQGPSSGGPLPPFPYKGFAITARTFQLRGSARWTLDLLIGRNGRLRSFGGSTTYQTEAGAVAACTDLGRRIIDGTVQNCTVADLC